MAVPWEHHQFIKSTCYSFLVLFLIPLRRRVLNNGAIQMNNRIQGLAPLWNNSAISLANTLSTTNYTDSTSRTVPGPGALSGKAILALGKATLRGAESLIIRRKFQIISSKFPHRDDDNIKGIGKMYEDILELSRHVTIHASFLRPDQVAGATYIQMQSGPVHYI